MRIRSALSALVVLAFSCAPALANKRVALVIGNGAYQNVPQLNNPVNDAKLMAETLQGLGFAVVGGGAQTNLDKVGLDKAIASFGTQVVGADVGLFYYAGHGVQVRNSNYLVPVGANPAREADVYLQMTDVGIVLGQMEGSGTKLNLVILDACRNNPFGGRGLRATDAGLAQIKAPEGTLISYATQPGNVAKDGTDGNSPYTKALAQTIKRGGLDIFQTFNEVGLTVKRATGGEQQPWVSSSPIDGSFYFNSAPTIPRVNPDPAIDADAVTVREYEAATRVGTKGAWDAFLAKHPVGFYSELARGQRGKLAAISPTNQPEAEPRTKPQIQSSPSGTKDTSRTSSANVGCCIEYYRRNAPSGWGDSCRPGTKTGNWNLGLRNWCTLVSECKTSGGKC